MRKLSYLAVFVLAFAVSALAQEAPKAEVSLGYSYMRANAGGAGFNLNGGSASFAGNVSSSFGIVGDFGGYHISEAGADLNVYTYLFGPRLSYRKQERVTPFVQALFGGARASAGFGGLTASENSFAMALGGGLDVKASSAVAIRIIQAEYLMTRFGGETQSNARISAGIVLRIGGK